MSTSSLIIAAAVAAAAAPAPPAKAPAGGANSPMTRTQFLANVKGSFDAVDTNHDGVLDSSEVTAAQQKQVEQARAEEQQRLDAEFTKLDTNRDGQLSKSEFMAAAPPVQPRETPQQIIGALDTNKDGKVSLQEYESRPLASFNRIDTNHDGVISQQELAAARASQQ